MCKGCLINDIDAEFVGNCDMCQHPIFSDQECMVRLGQLVYHEPCYNACYSPSKKPEVDYGLFDLDVDFERGPDL